MIKEVFYPLKETRKIGDQVYITGYYLRWDEEKRLGYRLLQTIKKDNEFIAQFSLGNSGWFNSYPELYEDMERFFNYSDAVKV